MKECDAREKSTHSSIIYYKSCDCEWCKYVPKLLKTDIPRPKSMIELEQLKEENEKLKDELDKLAVYCWRKDSSNKEQLYFDSNCKCSWCKVLQTQEFSEFIKDNFNKLEFLKKEIDILEYEKTDLIKFIAQLKTQLPDENERLKAERDKYKSLFDLECKFAERFWQQREQLKAQLQQQGCGEENHICDLCAGKPERKPHKCPICEGEGKYRYLERGFHSSTYQCKDCPRCNGNGVLWEPV